MDFTYLWGVFLLPLFKKEIADVLEGWKIFRGRNVNTGGKIELMNGATGEWQEVEILDYSFSILSAGRVVKFKDAAGRVQEVTFKQWVALRKGIKG